MGHDATVAIVADGKVVSHIEKERRARIKHAAIATIEDIDAALADAGIEIKDVDAVAVTTTQNWPFLFTEPDAFRFAYDIDRMEDMRLVEEIKGPIEQWIKQMGELEERARSRLVNFSHYPDTADLMKGVPKADDPNVEVLFTQQFPILPNRWRSARNNGTILPAAASFYRDVDWRKRLSDRFHLPITCTIRGREIKGAVIPHHLAHAATGFYQSDAETAAVVTYDGGHEWSTFGYTSGIYAMGEGDKLYPVWLNYSPAGNLYRRVADACDLQGMGGPGKLMGLSPYGAPRFHDPSFVGTMADLDAIYQRDAKRMISRLYERAWPYVRRAIALDRDEVTSFPMPTLSDFSKDLAASIQLTFEEQALDLADTAFDFSRMLGLSTNTLALSGGCALNCPANSVVWRESQFENVFVPPSCDDSGLALGAAFYMAHSIFDDPRAHQGADTGALAYLGRRIRLHEVDQALEKAGDAIKVEVDPENYSRAAYEVAAGRVIGWYEGRSEIGPRALGHRSIVADPRAGGNWQKVNTIKSREQWRPLAPAILAERFDKWFEGAPSTTPHMLFTADVKNEDLPAITHVDGSARVQTVDESCGSFRRMLEAFEQMTKVPVVMNTSLNGRGEPIVESPEDAIQMFVKSELDALYIDGRRVTKRKSESSNEADAPPSV